MEREFKTLEDWKAHLRRDKTKEIEDYKHRAGVAPMPCGDTMDVGLAEGELIQK